MTTTLVDYGRAVGDLNLANYRLGRAAALADEWGVLPPVGSKGAARTIIKRECSRALRAALESSS